VKYLYTLTNQKERIGILDEQEIVFYMSEENVGNEKCIQ
jgi:hypothetical protein